MRLDLGGIAKGFAADEALKMLSRSGIQKALVAIGGDIAVSGSPPGKQGWTVEIATDGFPQLQRPKPLLLCHAGVSTSGDAEQHVEIGGIRYSHIIDPRSGRALTGHSSVTVVARTAAESDSLATAVSVMGPEKGLKLVDSVKGAAVLIIEETVDGTRTFRSTRWKTD
jgi:thiamine biosynthesis lipoprotein